MKTPTKFQYSVVILLIALLCGSGAASAQSMEKQNPPLTPVVVFPAFHFTRLEVNVNNQILDPACPKFGTFEDWFPNGNPGQLFSQECKDKLLTLIYIPLSFLPMPERFFDRPGVTVHIKDFGKTTSAPFYEPLYVFLEANGYQRNKNIRVAGYDARLTPDMDGFLRRTIRLIEKTYYDNGSTPVHLIAHSNGPLYAQYLLTHTSQTWKNKYIHGFSPIAGNWPGQGSLYSILFTGLNTIDFLYPQTQANAASSAAMFVSHPSSYMSAADPAIFGNQEVVVQTLQGGKSYTPADNKQLFQDAGLPLAQTLGAYYIGFVKFADPASFPNVDVYAEKGSGLATTVGAVLQNLKVGQLIDVNNPAVFLTRDGDTNQEDITNDSIQVWNAMSCFRFELTDNPGVDHFSLPGNPSVLARLLNHLQQPRSVCP